MGEAAPARLDALTRHRLGLLGLDAAGVEDRSPAERLREAYASFVDRVPFETLSDSRVAAEAPGEPDAWPRTTERFLRDHRAQGLGGSSFTLAYALRDLFRGLGGNAHCALGHNLVREEPHAVVVVYEEAEPVLFDPALLLSGPVPVRPGGSLEDPLGRVVLESRSGASLTMTIRPPGSTRGRPVYSIVPVPAAPPAFRQAWIGSFCRGRPRPLRLARRQGDEIRRYGERAGVVEILRPGGREQRRLGPRPVGDLHALFGIAADCLDAWFSRPCRGPDAR